MKQTSSKILINGFSLFFAFALIFTQVTLQYYNAMSASEIVMAEEETETDCCRPILEEIHTTFDYKAKFVFNQYQIISKNKFVNKSYQAVYLAVFSPPPDFLSIS